MADVVPAYVPANGALFDPAGWTTDMHSATAGVSLYGELNGHIEDANFAAGSAIINARHVRPFESFRAEWGGAMDTQDWFEHLFGMTYNVNDWLAVPGAARRIYVPWAPIATQYHVSAFGTNLRMREVSSPPPVEGAAVYAGPQMMIAMFVDNVLVEHTKRLFPYSYYAAVNPGTPNYLTTRENVLTHHFDLVHVSGATAVGWHDVGLRVQILQNTGVERIFPLYDGAATAVDHSVTHRIRLGIRAASIMALL